tara:strand:- start:103 stop:411 length:309 start_codon:yes stop_codon:yes gene_type:complete
VDILIEARDLNTGELLNSFSIPEKEHSQEINMPEHDLQFYSNGATKGMRAYIENKAFEWAAADNGKGFANVRQHPSTVYYTARPMPSRYGETELIEFWYKFS